MEKKSVYTLKYDYLEEELDKITGKTEARRVALLIAGHYMPKFIYDQKLVVTLSTKNIVELYDVSYIAASRAKQFLKRAGFMEMVSMSISTGKNARPAYWSINRDFYHVSYVDWWDPDLPRLTRDVLDNVPKRFRRSSYLFDYLCDRYGLYEAIRLKREIRSQSGKEKLRYKYFATEIVRRNL